MFGFIKKQDLQDQLAAYLDTIGDLSREVEELKEENETLNSQLDSAKDKMCEAIEVLQRYMDGYTR